MGELIEEVKRVFIAQESEALGRVWTTYQSVLEQIMLAKGDNDLKMPHLHKKTANRRGAPIPRGLRLARELRYQYGRGGARWVPVLLYRYECTGSGFYHCVLVVFGWKRLP